MSIQDNIKNWVHIDNQCKLLNDKLKTLKETRTNYAERIFEDVKNRDLENLNINITDGALKVQNTNSFNPLTYKYLEECLTELFSKDKANDIISYMKNKRTPKKNMEIKRTYN